jgi:hypothetical protein
MSAAGRIAFLLMVHADPDMAVRLCQRLAPHAVFVHIDAKAVDFPLDRLRALPNVTVLPERESVYWSSFPMITATLALIRAALATAEDWLRLVTLSGADYPLRPLAELEAHFRAHPDRQDMALLKVRPHTHLAGLSGRHWRMMPLLSEQAMSRLPLLRALERNARKWRNRVAKVRGRDFRAETGREVHFGSNWWGLTPAAVRYALDEVDRDPRLQAAFATVWCPEEQFFQTILSASPYAAQCVPVTDRDGETLYEAPLHLIYPSGDRAFGNAESDFVLARDSGKFFARKLTSANAPLLERIDRELLHLS